MAIQPDLLVPLAEYRQALSASLARLKAAPRMVGVDEIRLPSERSHAERRRHLRVGITIDRSIHERLQSLASES